MLWVESWASWEGSSVVVFVDALVIFCDYVELAMIAQHCVEESSTLILSPLKNSRKNVLWIQNRGSIASAMHRLVLILGERIYP